MEFHVVKIWMKNKMKKGMKINYCGEHTARMLGAFLGWFCWLCLHDFLMVFPLDFWWSTSLGSEYSIM